MVPAGLMGAVVGMTTTFGAMLVIADRYARRWSRRQRIRNLASRASLDDEALYRLFCPDAELEPRYVARALNLAAEVLHIPAGLLRPLDRLQDIACPAPGWCRTLQLWDEIDDLADEFVARCPALMDRGDMETIGALVREAAQAWQTHEP